MMRYVLYDKSPMFVPLEKEVQFLGSYIDIMRLRYTDKLEITTDFSTEPNGVYVPSLLFMQFLENAFKHGVSYKNETHIDIKLCEMNGKIFFSCDNTIPVNNRDAVQEGGVGLSNVRRRLELLYGEEYSLRINETDER